jgi:hypothetical protein
MKSQDVHQDLSVVTTLQDTLKNTEEVLRET